MIIGKGSQNVLLCVLFLVFVHLEFLYFFRFFFSIFSCSCSCCSCFSFSSFHASSYFIRQSIYLGMVGFFGIDIFGIFLGSFPVLFTRILFGLIGIAGIYAFTLYGKLDDNIQMERY